MTRFRRRAGFAAIALLFAAYFGTVVVGLVVVAGSAADLTVFLGQAHIQRTGTSSSIAGRSGDELQAGDVVRTDAGARAAVNYPDGSLTRMDQNAVLRVTSLASPSSGVWNVGLLETEGKFWNRVVALASGASFKVTAASTSVEVRGTEFEVIVATGVVRVDSWTGAVAVSSSGQTVTLTGGQSTTVSSQGAPTPAASIPDSDRTDSFTIFNQSLDVAQGPVVALGTGTLAQGGSTTLSAGVADGSTDLELTLGWPGSKFELDVIGPDGTTARSVTSDQPPASLVIPKAAQGEWKYTVKDVESTAGEPFWVIVSWLPHPALEDAAAQILDTWDSTRAFVPGNAYEGGPLKAMDEAGRLLQGQYRGDPVHLIYASGEFQTKDGAELFVSGPSTQVTSFLALVTVDLNRLPSSPQAELLVGFSSSGASEPEATMAAFLPDGFALPEIARGADGYAIQLPASAYGRYLVSPSQLGAAFAADLNQRLHGAAGDPNFANDSAIEQGVAGIMADQAFTKRQFGWTEQVVYAAEDQYQPYVYELADGSALELVTTSPTWTTTAAPGGCVDQPSAQYRDPSGQPRYEVLLGPTRGVYGSVTQVSQETFAAVIPPKNSGRTVRLIGGWSQIASWTTTACSGRGKPGSDSGATFYL